MRANELLGARAAAYAAGVSASAVWRAAARGALPVAARTARGHRLYDPRDVLAFRRARIARLAGQLRVATEPRAGAPWDSAASGALDLAADTEDTLARR